jgi:hypothetical protein
MAESIVGKLKYLITGDTKPLNKNVKSSQKQLNSLRSSLGTIATAAVGAFGAAVVINSIKNFTQQSLQAASALEEVNNKFNVTFSTVKNEAAAVAKALQKSYGLSERESKELLSATGDLLTGFGFAGDKALEMSEKVNKLAVDLASFQNIEGGAERASQALTSAMLGETEAAKSLGIVIRQNAVNAKLAEKGLEDLTGEAKLQAEAQARLEIAVEQSKNAIGDYQRSADSAANVDRRYQSSVEDLKAALGKSLLPTTTRVKSAFADLIGRMADAINHSNDLKKALEKIESGSEALNTDEKMALIDSKIKQAKNQLAGYNRAMERGYATDKKRNEDVIQRLTDQVEYYEKLKQVSKDNVDIGGSRLAQEQQIVKLTAQKAEDEKETTGELEKQVDLQAKLVEDMKTKLQEAALETNKLSEAWAGANEVSKEHKLLIAKEIVSTYEDLAENYAIAAARKGKAFANADELKALAEAAQTYIDKIEGSTEAITEHQKSIMELTAEAGQGFVQMSEASTEMWQNYGEQVGGAEEQTETFEEALRGVLLTWLGIEEEVKRGESEKREEIKKTANTAVEVASWASSAVIDIVRQQNRNEMIAHENEKQAAIDALKEKQLSEEKFAKAKEEIDKKYNEKRKKLLIDQAKDEKSIAIFQSIIDTAAAAAKALTAAAPPLNFILAAAVTALGAAKTAMISQQPIPKMAEGGLVERETAALMGEGNRPEAVLPLTDRRAMDQIAGAIGEAMARQNPSFTANQQIIVRIGDRDFDGYIEKQIDNGKILINPKAIKR